MKNCNIGLAITHEAFNLCLTKEIVDNLKVKVYSYFYKDNCHLFIFNVNYFDDDWKYFADNFHKDFEFQEQYLYIEIDYMGDSFIYGKYWDNPFGFGDITCHLRDMNNLWLKVFKEWM